MVNRDHINRHAKAREYIHKGKRSSRPLSPDYEKVGLAGEAAFAERFKVEVDLTIKPGGSKGINFVINGYKINVMTARKANYLLVEPGKVKADVYVLAAYNDLTKDAYLMGWATKEEIEAASISDIGGFGIKSHAIYHTRLSDIDELDVFLGLREWQPTLF